MNDIEKAFIVSTVQKEIINFPKQSDHINKLAFELYDILFKNNEVDKNQENKRFRLLNAIKKIEAHAKLIGELVYKIENSNDKTNVSNFTSVHAACNQIINVELKDLKSLYDELY